MTTLPTPLAWLASLFLGVSTPEEKKHQPPEYHVEPLPQPTQPTTEVIKEPVHDEPIKESEFIKVSKRFNRVSDVLVCSSKESLGLGPEVDTFFREHGDHVIFVPDVANLSIVRG